MPLVSVVMAAWRPRADWLLTAVRSVLDEHGCELELVLVDDGNAQPVEELVVAIDDVRLRVVRIVHTGQSAARNAGIGAARGTHFRFVDCDDVVPSGSTTHLLALCGGGDDLIGYGATQFCDEDLTPRALRACDLHGPAASACLLDRFPVYVPAMLFPKRVVGAAGPWEESMDVMADWEWVLRALEHTDVRGDDRCVYLYRQHGESIQGRTSNERAEHAHHRIVNAYFMRHPEATGGAFERRVRAGVHLKYARTYLRDRRPARSVDRLIRGTRLDPPAGARVALALAARQLRPSRG